MTLWKRLANSLFAIALGAALAGMPAIALADDEGGATRGIADQFSAFSEEVDEDVLDADVDADVDADDGSAADADADTSADAATAENEGVSAGVDATGDWQKQAAPDTYVFDEYGLFSEDEYAALESAAESLAQKYNMGVYFLTTDLMGDTYSPSSDVRTRFATKYYMDHALGLGTGKDGIMFTIAVRSRDYVTIAYGQGSYSFSDDGIESMEDDVTGYLHDNEWYEAARAYYEDMEQQLGYYADKGSTYRPRSFGGLVISLLITILLPLLIALGVVRREKAAHKTAHEKNEASEYLDRSSFVLTAQRDEFINSSVVATPRHDSSDSGGGGGWGGGGGGGFSSSGGGKF